MKYINDGDLEFIMGKYHDPGKPFDPLHRFVCREDIFDKSTGLSPAIIKERILENDAANAGRSRILRKTDASVFVLDNTRILVSEHDYFPAVQCIDRTVGKTLVKMWQKETESLFFPETAEEIALLDRTGAASVYPDYDHSVPVWARILGLGFEGIRAEAEGLRRRLSGTAGITEKQDAFFEAVDREYSAVLRLIRRLSALAESEEKRNAPSSEKTDGTTPDSKLHELGKELLTVSAGPPKTFYGALLVIYIYFVVCEHIDGLQTRSLSGLDRTLLPFYRRDLARGVPEEKLRTYL
ncbi:MAG: pyruvate formate lyase family protein, partial [Clostridia bacterium]|nr:pyruvate formate lyase family protein [Clostridia bacterium]